MCGLYTREINLKSYFLYIQHGIKVIVKTYPSEIFWIFCSTRYWAANEPPISRPMHEIYIPRREGGVLEVPHRLEISKFHNSPCEDHWNAVIRISKYIKGSPKKRIVI